MARNVSDGRGPFMLAFGGEFYCRIDQPHPNEIPIDGSTKVVSRDELLTDASTERISRAINSGPWEVVDGMEPAAREPYEEALRSATCRALSAAMRAQWVRGQGGQAA